MIGSASAALMVGFASTAHAQASGDAASTQASDTATDDAGGDIVVRGFRASVFESIAAKRESPIIVDVVSAADIAGLPDVSIAEAIARLPGVTSPRGGGQASAINIRGPNQDLLSASLHGREQGATSGLRTIEFDQYTAHTIHQTAV